MKKAISFVLIVVMIVSLLPVVTMEAEAVTLSESEFANKISYLRTVYRDKEYWNGYNSVKYEGTGPNKCACTNSCAAKCPCDCGKFYLNNVKYGGQCFGFANKMAYIIFGSIPDLETRSTHGDWIYYSGSSSNGFYAGDYVRVRNNAHSIFITAVNGDTITYVDCNNYGPCQVKWDRTISKAELLSKTTYVYRLSGNTLLGNGTNVPHTHSYSGSHYEAAHPHKEYRKCSCGAVQYTGGTKTVSSCTTCKPSTSHTHSYSGSYYESAHPHKEYRKCSCGAAQYTGGTRTVGSCTTCNPVPVNDPTIVHMDFPSGNYDLSNNIEVKGWIASDEPITWVMCNVSDYGQINLGMWDNPDEAAEFSQYTYFKRFSGVIEASKLTAGRTYSYHVFSSDADGVYDGVFSTGVQQSNDWKYHLDTPTGTHTRYDHLELKGWLACNQKPAYILSELVGIKQWDMHFYESGEVMEGYRYFMRFSTVIDINLLEPNKTYTIKVWSDLGWAPEYTFHTGDIKPELYNVVYDANGGTDVPETQIKTQLKELTLTSAIPAREGYTFLGWATSADAGAAQYQPGDKFAADAHITLYAVWESICESTGHEYVYSVTTHPTTTAAGTLTGACRFCGATATVSLPKLSEVDYSCSLTQTATCTADGSARYTWNNINYGSFSFEAVLPATGHSYTDQVTAPTCTTGGYTAYTCANCGDSYIDGSTAALGHSYLDGTCTRCGGVDPDAAVDENAPQVVLDSKKASQGSTVSVDFKVLNNPGFSVLNVAFLYDSQYLTLTSVENKVPSMVMTQGASVLWDSAANYTANGLLATLSFTVAEDAPEGDCEIRVVFMGASNEDFEEVKLAAVSGVLTVSDLVYGDANGDGQVTTVDLAMLRKYLAGMDPITGVSSVAVKAGADCSGDGTVNTIDLAMLRKYLAGMDPITGESSVVLGPK